MKIFSLLGDVQGVGFRLNLVDTAFQHGIRMWPKNVEGGKRVDVIILEGDAEQVQKYYQEVKNRDHRIDRHGDMYKATDMQEYDGPAPDWTYEMMRFTVEQLKTGAGEYFLMKKALEKILERLDSAR